jgi:hypothetical protein
MEAVHEIGQIFRKVSQAAVDFIDPGLEAIETGVETLCSHLQSNASSHLGSTQYDSFPFNNMNVGWKDVNGRCPAPPRCGRRRPGNE